jgi:hypothetical protein
MCFKDFNMLFFMVKTDMNCARQYDGKYQFILFISFIKTIRLIFKII